MRAAIFTIAAVLASAIGRVTIAQYGPNPPSENRIYNDKSGLTLAHAAQMASASTELRPDHEKEEKLEGDAALAAASGSQTTAERIRIKKGMQPTAAQAPMEYANSSATLKIVSSEKSDDSRRAMLKRRLSELQAERRSIEEGEYSLRFAVLEIEGNDR